MIITCCCCTYRRPKQVGYIIDMFHRQTHKDKRLLILADDGCFGFKQSAREKWTLIPRPLRYDTLGEKRNACVEMAKFYYADTEAIAVFDDDDSYMPWHLESANAALEQADWSLPSEVLYRNDDGTYRRHLTGPGKFFHGGMAFRLKAFNDSHGYPENLSGPEDAGLFLRLDAIRATICDPIALTGKPPSYVYGTNDGLMHISAYLKDNNDTGADAYAKMAEQECQPQELVITAPPNIELDNPIILPGVLPRPF